MRKLLFTLLLCLSCCLHAQDKMLSNTMSDGWFLGFNGGVITPQTEKVIRPEAGVELGLWLTPAIGLGVTDEMQINNTGAKTAIDCNSLSADLHVSVFNWIDGYNTRWYDVEVIPSFVWYHYTKCMYGQNHRNFAGVAGSLRFLANFGKERQWQFYVQPSITYVDRPRADRGFIEGRAGLIYRFRGENSRSHTFAFIKEGIPQERYDKVVAENALLKAKPKTVTKEVTVVKEVNMQKLFFVNFAHGECLLNQEAIDILNTIPKGSTVNIEGFATPDGSEAVNQDLSEQRAEVVKYYLEEHGIIVKSAVGKGTRHTYHSNRIAVITIVK